MCQCKTTQPYWFEERCEACIIEDARIWAEAMEAAKQICARIERERNDRN